MANQIDLETPFLGVIIGTYPIAQLDDEIAQPATKILHRHLLSGAKHRRNLIIIAVDGDRPGFDRAGRDFVDFSNVQTS